MKRAITASVLVVSAIVSVACTSAVETSSSAEGTTAETHEAVTSTGPGCATVALTPTGSATTNEGASFANDTFANCNSTPGIAFTSNASYTGTAACSDAAILELKNPTGLPVFGLHIVSPPTQEGDCEATQVQGEIWGMKVVNGQPAWTDIASPVLNGTWQGSSGPCVYNAGTGEADWYVFPSASWSGYTTLRFAASAQETTGLKGTPTTKLYAVTLSAFDTCVY